MDYLEDLLSEQIPTSEETEKLGEISSAIIREINDICRANNINASCTEVGSVSKNTNLKSSDIDIFITFDKAYPVDYIEKKGLEIGHRVLKNGTEKYAEHPYVSGYVKGIKVDIVPAFKINNGEKIVSTVDRTPLHTLYVNSNTNEAMIHDIRLLKVFMKRINVYGSEIARSGFSGYLCELLIIHFKNFDRLMKHMANLRGKLIVPEDAEDKFAEPVIIIDPVDPSRNAGAAVSEENLSRLKLASKIYISGRLDILNHTPSVNRERGTHIRVFVIKKPDIIDDIIYPQAVRLKNRIWDILHNNGFMPVASEIYMGNDIEILIECKLEKLPGTKVHMGPPVESNESIRFIDMWNGNPRLMRGPYILKNRVYVDVRTEQRDMEGIIRKELRNSDIGKNLNEFRDEIKIINGEDADLEVVRKFFSKYLFN
ncbi:MAG: CCA tRNA nucleotidyltransferase [Ferroplasma sp.]|uniref:CCA tRNA nucleotidyltransferase n=1 Tax=Ferroplasma sp. TaxID=2591003 RepID=UPI002815B5BF|nr:CCA tRNA nucleotidyltransferase [Ferroplasma sp.]WMT51572.1 MAG: CCA tRNA nucleotidyltransferase [Ferroplasma sp.]